MVDELAMAKLKPGRSLVVAGMVVAELKPVADLVVAGQVMVGLVPVSSLAVKLEPWAWHGGS